MIFRNSLKSILRTPIKTFLFTLLIMAVTAFLYLGINTWAASSAMLRDWDNNCSTIVTLEYLEDYGSDKGSKSEAMLADVAGIDFDAIASNENMLLWQPSDVGMGIAAGYVENDLSSEYSSPCVLVVTGLRQYAEDSPYYGNLVESLYSYRPYEAGRSVFIHFNREVYEFKPDQNATYVIHAENLSVNQTGLSVEFSPFYSWIAQQAGVDCASIMPFHRIESAEALRADENNIYNTIAKYYAAMNNSLTICRVRDLANLEEFHQNYLQPVSGRLFTGQEGDEGARVCVISETVAKSRDLKVGDELTLYLPDKENAPTYAWGDQMSREETFTIVGIVNYHPDYNLNIYTPGNSDSARPARYFYDLGQATIKNGTVNAFLSQIKPLLPERIYLAVYDQGYQITADALKVIQNAAIALSVIALAVTLSVLAFFAFLFAEMQQDAVEIMRCFGTSKSEARLYLMAGTSVIALVSITAGILIGTGYAGKLVQAAYEFISELQSVDMRYSDGFRGIAREFAPVVTLSYALAAAVGIGVLFISLALCLYFSERTISGRLINARGRVRVCRSPNKSSAALSGSIRHAVLSIRRGGARSLMVPVLCSAALLFVSSLQSTLSSYDEARENLYKSTELSGYSAQMNGKFSDRLFIPNKLAKVLVGIDLLSDTAYTYTLNYLYLGIPLRADGSEGQTKPEPFPTNSFDLENMLSTLLASPGIVFTDTVSDAPEFYYGEFHSDYMSGWNEERFSRRDWETLPCLVSSNFMSEHDIKPGDTIRVFTSTYLRGQPYFFSLDMQVTGSFTRVAKQDNIYCPLPLGALDPASSSLNEFNYKRKNVITGEYFSYVIAALDFNKGEGIHTLTQQQMLDVMLDSKYVSSLTFKVLDPGVLGDVKDALEERGFSGPKMANDIRLCIVIEDAQFNATLSSISQRSKYLEILYPVLLALVCVLGLITGFLAVRSRREDIALMRAMGTRKRRIFSTIFGEQLLLLLFGSLSAAAAWYILKGTEQLDTFGVYAFFICYALSAALSALLQNAKSALSILSEKE